MKCNENLLICSWLVTWMDGQMDRHALPCVHLHIMQRIHNDCLLLQEIETFIQNKYR